jgi:hypothetical protein
MGCLEIILLIRRLFTDTPCRILRARRPRIDRRMCGAFRVFFASGFSIADTRIRLGYIPCVG